MISSPNIRTQAIPLQRGYAIIAQLPTERLNELRDSLRDGRADRCEWGELTSQEQQELISYEDLQQVDRLKALLQTP